MNQFYAPDWLDAWRVSENLRKEAYDEATADSRALLKTALALTSCRFMPSAPIASRQYCNKRLGIWSAALSQPARWTVIVLDNSFAAAARVCAAAALPALAEVEYIFAVSINGAPAKAALVALELAGIEDVFHLDQNQLERFFLETDSQSGRVILLHSGQLDEIAATCRRLRIPFYEEASPPELFLASPESFNSANLIFAQGVLPATVKPSRGWIDAIYTDNMDACEHNENARLILTPGCEGFWLFPGLNKSFFYNIIQKFALTNGDGFALP